MQTENGVLLRLNDGTTTPSNLAVFTPCSSLAAGCTLYKDVKLSIVVDNGYYGDGTSVYTVSAGVITAVSGC
jgi:hypothetical protein